VNPNQIVEAVLFASDAPLTADEIARADEALDEDRVEEAIRFLQAEYDDAERAFQVVMLAEGYQILTRPEFAPYLERFDNVPRPSRLSGPALETLAIIAYRQPIGRIEIEYIRGVGCAGVLKTLTDRELVDVVARAEGLGRPVLYGTTRRFLEHFGFQTLEDLPRPEELPVVLRERVPLGPEPEEPAESMDPAAEQGEGPAVDGTDEWSVTGAVAEGDDEDRPDQGTVEASEEEPEGVGTLAGPAARVGEGSAVENGEAEKDRDLA
jgi:segregation and condensation protein B